jgi:hypothetical protein
MVTTSDDQITPLREAQDRPQAGWFDGVQEIRECTAKAANELLAAGWRLQGVYPYALRVEAKACLEPRRKDPASHPYVRKGMVYVMLRCSDGDSR